MDAEKVLELMKNMERHEVEDVMHRTRLDKRIDTVVEALRQNTESAAEVLALYGNLKGAFRVLGWVSAFATWLGKMSVAAGIVWAIWKYLVLEALTTRMKG